MITTIPSTSLGSCAPSSARLDALATKAGEKSGPGGRCRNPHASGGARTFSAGASNQSPVRRFLLRHPWSGDLLSLAAGLALPLAFAPYGFGVVAPVAVAALYLCWLDASPARALWRGWLFGAGAFGAGVSWIVHSFLIVQVAPPVAVFLTGGLIALLAFYPGLTGYLVRRFVPASPARVLLAASPAAWVLMEWSRGWLLTGFPWLELGYSQVDGPLGGWFAVLGVHGVSFAVALSGGTLAFLAASAERRRWAALALPLVLWSAGGGLGLVAWTQPAGAPLRIALVQGNIPQEEKWRPEMREPTLARYLALSRRHAGADLVVWPETALPALYQSMEPFARALDTEFAAAGSGLLFGVPWRDDAQDRVFNSLVLLGSERGLYHKRHLVPFGEYLPFRPFFLPITRALGVPSPDFSRGSPTPLPSVAGHPVALSICYEIAFAAEVAASLPEAALLVTVSNDAWFGASIGPHQHLEIARARAMETGRYLARATNTGISALVSPAGEVLARSPQFEVDVIEADVAPMSGATPYVTAGNAPAVGSALVLLLAAFAGPRLRSRLQRGFRVPWGRCPRRC